MPVTSTVEADRIRIDAEGTYTYAEVVAAFEAALAIAPRRLPVLVDARRSEVSPPYDELWQTARYADEIAPRIGPRVALVVEGALRFGLARMLTMLGSVTSPLEWGTFRELTVAEAWLAHRAG